MPTSPPDGNARPLSPRFLTLKDVQAEMQISEPQARALIQRGELRALQVGGRGQWRIERTELEAYIQRMYEQTAKAIAEGQAIGDQDPAEPDAVQGSTDGSDA